MKVMMFIPHLNLGGAEKFAVDLSCRLRTDGHQVALVCTDFRGETPLYEQTVQNDVEFYDVSNSSIIERTKSIRKLIFSWKPDVVHLNLHTLTHVILAGVLGRVKVKIFTFHTVASNAADGSKLRKFVYRYGFRQLNIVPVGISDFITKSIVDEYGLKESKVHCVHNGVDIERFVPDMNQKSKTSSSVVELISVGRFYEVKNHKLMIDAFEAVHREFPDTVLRLLGDGDLFETTKDYVTGKSLEDCIIFEGNRQNVVEYLQKADIYVNSSDYEGMPLSVLEAMGCGLPVSATKAGGVVDVVEEGINGYLCDTGDVHGMVLSMERLIKDTEIRRTMGLASLEIVKRWSFENCLKGYLRLYNGEV